MSLASVQLRRLLYSRVFRNLCFWFLFGLFIAVSRNDNKLLTFFILPWVLIISFGIPCYFNNFWLIPRFYIKRNYFIFYLLFIVLLAFTTIESYYVTWLVNTINPACRYMGNFRNEAAIYFALPSGGFLITLAVGKFTADAISNQRKFELLEKEKLKSELESLKLQVSPHFILNALSSINGLLQKNNPLAAEAAVKLSDILRYILSDCSGNRISIQKEIDFLQQYIAFTRLRTRPNAIVNFTVEHDDGAQQIAPLLLLPIVENALKHGLSRQIQYPWVKAQMKVKGNFLYFYCANSNYDKTAQSINTSSGIGFKNVKARLELIYNKHYTLIINESPDTYTLELKIQLI